MEVWWGAGRKQKHVLSGGELGGSKNVVCLVGSWEGKKVWMFGGELGGSKNTNYLIESSDEAKMHTVWRRVGRKQICGL